MVHQRHDLDDRLAVLREVLEFPNLTLAYSEGQIGWIPYCWSGSTTFGSSTGRRAARRIGKSTSGEPPAGLP